MIDRRTFVLSAALGCAGGQVLAAPAPVNFRRTLLFNFKDDLPAAEQDRAAAAIRSQAARYSKGVFLARKIGPVTPSAPYSWVIINDMASEEAFEAFRASTDYKDLIARYFTLGQGYATFTAKAPITRPIADVKGLGYRHLMGFTFKAEASAALQGRVVEGLKRLGALSTVKSFFIGANAAPPTERTATFGWQLIADFAGEDDYQAWRRHPLFQTFMNADFHPNQAAVITMDMKL